MVKLTRKLRNQCVKFLHDYVSKLHARGVITTDDIEGAANALAKCKVEENSDA